MGGWSGGGDCHCPYSDSSGHSSCHYSLQAANEASNTTGRCAWLQFHAGPTYIGIYAVLCTFIHAGAHMYDTMYSAPNELRHSEGVHVEGTANGELSTEAIMNLRPYLNMSMTINLHGVTHACVHYC